MLTQPELVACLLKLESQGGQAAAPASQAVLDELLRQGLIERISTQFLPLENPAFFYRLTQAGWRECSKLHRRQS